MSKCPICQKMDFHHRLFFNIGYIAFITAGPLGLYLLIEVTK